MWGNGVQLLLHAMQQAVSLGAAVPGSAGSCTARYWGSRMAAENLLAELSTSCRLQGAGPAPNSHVHYSSDSTQESIPLCGTQWNNTTARFSATDLSSVSPLHVLSRVFLLKPTVFEKVKQSIKIWLALFAYKFKLFFTATALQFLTWAWGIGKF